MDVLTGIPDVAFYWLAVASTVAYVAVVLYLSGKGSPPPDRLARQGVVGCEQLPTARISGSVSNPRAWSHRPTAVRRRNAGAVSS